MANLETGQPASLLSGQSTVPPDKSAEEHGNVEEPAQDRENIEDPTKLVRLAHMLRALLDEVRSTELDEAARQRLADIHNRSLDLLRQVMSADLAAELDEVADPVGGIPSHSELRVAQAQLIGWLEGLFRGIQASMAHQQLAAQQERQHMMRPPRPLEPGQAGPGQYL